MDPNTGIVSPQFHISFDDFFETTRTLAANTFASPWQRIAGFSHHIHSIASEGAAQHQESPTRPNQNSFSPVQSSQPLGGDDINNASSSESAHNDQTEVTPSEVPTSTPPVEQETTYFEQNSSNIGSVAPTVAPTTTSVSATRRSTRIRRPSNRLRETIDSGSYHAFMTSIEDPTSYYDALHQDDYKMQDDMRDPVSFFSKN